jgi:uncharacterized membrane protein
MDLLSILTSFGLGAAAGQRAIVPMLVVGLLHNTSFFDLGESWAWLGSPSVLVVLAVLSLAEIIVDWYPDSARVADIAGWVTRTVSGAMLAAAVMGSLDPTLSQLVWSGALGGTTALAMQFVRQPLRASTRELSDSGISGSDRASSVAETSGAVVLPAAAIAAPWAVIPLLVMGGGLLGLLVWLSRSVRGALLRVGGLKTS